MAPRRPSAARGYSDDSLGCRSVVSGDSDNVCGGERYGKLDVRDSSVMREVSLIKLLLTLVIDFRARRWMCGAASDCALRSLFPSRALPVAHKHGKTGS